MRPRFDLLGSHRKARFRVPNQSQNEVHGLSILAELVSRNGIQYTGLMNSGSQGKEKAGKDPG